MRLTLILLFLPITSFSQVFEKEVISSNGDSFQSGSIEMGYTVGEIAIDSYSTSYTLSEGFWNDCNLYNWSCFLSINEDESSYNINMYPNPADNDLNFSFSDQLKDEKVEVRIYNMVGELVHSETFFSPENISVDISSVASGTYTISIVSDQQIIKTEKFQKL